MTDTDWPVKGTPPYDDLVAAWATHRDTYQIPGPGLHAAYTEFRARWVTEHRGEYE